jgi:hypothetical protein
MMDFSGIGAGAYGLLAFAIIVAVVWIVLALFVRGR